MRDIGGRTGLDRRRVKQGMIYRSAGLNSNACKLYTEKEVRQMYKDGTLLSEVPEKSRKAAAKIKAALDKGEKTDLRHLVREWIPGKERLNDASRAFAEKQFGIKTDIDLRTSDRECFGMTGSPLGPNVRWINISSSAYGGMSGQKGREAFTKVFKIFLDSDNYPIDFHCIAGADRTGAVAAIIEGLLGVDEEEIWKDWETTAFYNTNIDFAHHRIDALMSVFAAYEGDTLNKRIEGYVLSLGFTADDIAKLRSIMLE